MSGSVVELMETLVVTAMMVVFGVIDDGRVIDEGRSNAK
jgi:hypothetical protein